MRQPLVSASLAFWFGWWFLISGGLFTIEQGWRNISLYSAPYIETLFHGAFVGFLLGSFFGGIGKPKQNYLRLVVLTERIVNVYGPKILLALFLLGSLIFAQRVATVGLGSDFLSDLRGVYNQRQGGALLRIGSHLSVLMTTFIILRGVYDSYHGLNIRSLIVTILAGAPLGLANGGRMFLMSYTLAYLASLLLCRSSFSRNLLSLTVPECFRITGLVCLLLTIFAVMGFVRGGYGDELNILYSIIIWPVSTLQQMDTWISVALTSDRTYGLNSFGWVASLLDRLGFIAASDASGVMRDVLYYFNDNQISAAVVPRSILPDLIFDFGPLAIFPTMAIIAFLLEWATTRYTGRGFFLHVVAVQCLLGSFTTIQNSVISPGFAVTIFWGAVISYLIKKRSWRDEETGATELQRMTSKASS
jgi:hypothetical protein